MAESNPENIVHDPHDHDVLLGRGGLSNHHPGNIWYRRLVRSNNTLYDQSKKHTKVLVARAIVHNVQSQDPPGRFLEKDQTTGLWILASYDKAVHKTSQALREKRVLKKDVSIQVAQTISIPIAAPAEDGIASEQAATVTTTTAVTVAQENTKLSRKTAAVTMIAATEAPENELADTKWSRLEPAGTKTAATFVQKNERLGFDTKLSWKAASITTSAAKVALENDNLDTEQSQEAEIVTLTAAKVAQENEQFDTTQTESLFWSDLKTRNEASSSQADRIPSPTEPTRQQSSTLLRYVAKSQKGLAANPISYGINTTKETMMMHGGFDQSIEQHQFARVDTQCMEPVSLEHPLYQNTFDHDGISSHSIEPLSLYNNHHDTVESLLPPDAPSLTRVTTQMSDGKQSFWPVGDARYWYEEEDVKGQHHRMQVDDPVRPYSERSQVQNVQKQEHIKQLSSGPASASQTSTSPDSA